MIGAVVWKAGIDGRQRRTCPLPAQMLPPQAPPISEGAMRELARQDREREAMREQLSARKRALLDGEIMALDSRVDGKNGLFSKGDLGAGCFAPDGTVRIVWPNGTQSSTTW